jgi:hypothetical protein
MCALYFQLKQNGFALVVWLVWIFSAMGTTLGKSEYEGPRALLCLSNISQWPMSLITINNIHQLSLYCCALVAGGIFVRSSSLTTDFGRIIVQYTKYLSFYIFPPLSRCLMHVQTVPRARLQSMRLAFVFLARYKTCTVVSVTYRH